MELYKALLDRSKKALTPLGFTKNSSTFYRKNEGNWGLIDFQKSKNNLGGELKFTINIGICSEKIRFFLEGKSSSKPSIVDCHWQNRIGFLLPIKKDHWWVIDRDTDIDVLYNEIADALLNYCVPEINEHISDESLEKNWRNGICAGIGELQRYIYLTTLLKIYNRPTLTDLIDDFKNYSLGKPIEDVAAGHIKKLIMT